MQDDGGMSKILQPYPEIVQKTFFPSFDYLDKPYADYLDSLATIFILWSASSIFLQCVNILNGKNTKSLALKDLTDRMLGMNVAKWLPFVKYRSLSYKPRIFSVVRLWFHAILTFLFLIALDALVIFSQTSKGLSRGLDSLNLRQLVFRKPLNESLVDGGLGCTLMVDQLTLNDVVPLYYCTEIYSYKSPIHVPPDRAEIYYELHEDRYFQISFPRLNRSDYSRTRLSVQLRDQHNSIVYYANLSTWEFKVTKDKLKWIVDIIKEKCHLCDPKSLDHNQNGAKISVSLRHWKDELTKIPYNSVHQMVELSENLIRSEDFIVPKNQRKDALPLVFAETTSGSVKRVSGVILWIIAITLELIRILCGSISWDINDKLDEMMARILDLPAPDFLKYSPNVAFEIFEKKETSAEDQFDHGEKMISSGYQSIRRKN